jgi:hypothetical protein
MGLPNDYPSLATTPVRNCKLVKLQGGASDGITTTVHVSACAQIRNHDTYISRGKHDENGLEIFEFRPSAK